MVASRNGTKLLPTRSLYAHQILPAPLLQVLASVSNEMLFAGNLESSIPALVNDVKDSSSVAAWAVSNELSGDGRCVPITKCLPMVVKAVNLVAGLDASRPVMVVTVFDGGFSSAKAVRRALAAGELLAW